MPRLTRRQRATVRGFVRWSARGNNRPGSILREVERRNALKLAQDGDKALILYLQDVGGCAISVRQILSEVRANGRPWLKRAQKTFLEAT